MAGRFRKTYLTADEMIALDDGQEWYREGDTVIVAGYLPDDTDDNPTFSLSVNGRTVADNWIDWRALPEAVQVRLSL